MLRPPVQFLQPPALSCLRERLFKCDQVNRDSGDCGGSGDATSFGIMKARLGVCHQNASSCSASSVPHITSDLIYICWPVFVRVRLAF